MSGRLARRARRIAGDRRLPAERRKRLADEIRAHLEDAAAEYRSRGFRPRRAEKMALKDFGDAKKCRTDLRRAWRGRRVVLFPEAAREHLASFLIYDLKSLILILAVVLLLRWQVVAAYYIPSDSMEPVLHGDEAHGDKILVNKLSYRLGEPERWQIAVFESRDGDTNLIKRIGGLPGDEFDIRAGDVFVNGAIARKPADVQEALLVPVFADGRLRVGSDAGEVPGLDAWSAQGTWAEEDGIFRCVSDGEEPTLLRWPRAVTNRLPDGVYSGSLARVGDLALRFRVTAAEGTGRIGLELREGADCFEFLLPVGRGDVVLRRSKEEVARVEDFGLEAGVEHRVAAANLDDRVTLEVDGKRVLSWDVPDSATVGQRDEVDGGEPRPAAFGIQGGAASFRDVELLRDVFYRGEGRFVPSRIPEDHYFMLGDNSGNSTDSRRDGPVHRDRLIGRPMVIIWPFSRLRVVH